MRGYQFDLRKFVDDLGGPTACWRRLQDMGVELKPRTINKQLERGDMALVYIVNLMAHRALEEGPVDLNRYILPSPGSAPIRPRLSAAPGSEPAPAPPHRTALQG